MNHIKLTVKEGIDLVEYLLKYTDYNKKKIKTLLKFKNIYINGSNKFKIPHFLRVDEQIEIKVNFNIIEGLEIIYEDSDILVVNKEAGLLTIGTDKEREKTLYHRAREYAKINNFKIFIVHRLDKETSGIVILAKTEKIKNALQNSWEELARKRRYVAVVEGKTLENGRIDNLLYEEESNFVHSSKIGKRAITNYKTLKSNEKFTMLDIEIETGRKNQIRVHLSEMGNPIIGDKKYGAKTDPIKRLGLHATELIIVHPFTNKTLNFHTEIPQKFKNIF